MELEEINEELEDQIEKSGLTRPGRQFEQNKKIEMQKKIQL